jgi:hypothetical protein
LRRLATERVGVQARREFLKMVGTLHDLLLQARRQLRRFSSIPADAPASCRCDGGTILELPDFIARQCWDLDSRAG